MDAVLRDQELEFQGTREAERPPGWAQFAMEETEPFGARHHVQPQQSRRVRPFHRDGGRFFKLRHRAGQRAGKRSRGVLTRTMHQGDPVRRTLMSTPESKSSDVTVPLARRDLAKMVLGGA